MGSHSLVHITMATPLSAPRLRGGTPQQDTTHYKVTSLSPSTHMSPTSQDLLMIGAETIPQLGSLLGFPAAQLRGAPGLPGTLLPRPDIPRCLPAVFRSTRLTAGGQLPHRTENTGLSRTRHRPRPLCTQSAAPPLPECGARCVDRGEAEP